MGKSLLRKSSGEAEDTLPVCNLFGKKDQRACMASLDTKHSGSQNEDGVVSCSEGSRPKRPRVLSESKQAPQIF